MNKKVVSLFLCLSLILLCRVPATAAETDALTEGLNYYYSLNDCLFDADRAYSCFSEAAENGEGEAFYYLGCLTLMSTKEDRFETAMHFFDQAIDAGCAYGYLGKGRLYENGQGVERDYEMAMSLYTNALDHGCADANGMLGDLYRTGHGVDRDYALALAYYEKALSDGDPLLSRDVYASIGNLYYSGLAGIHTDFDLANDWYQRGIEAGSVEAIRRSGSMYRGGFGVEKDLQKALSLYETAASHGSSDAMCSVADLLLQNGQSDEEAAAWYQKAMDLGNPEAMIQVGNRCRNVDGDFEKAFEFYQKALNAGYVPAYICFGYSYWMQHDYVKERECYLKAADLGDAIGMYNLGYVYEYGESVSQNKQTALEWYLKGAEVGDATCMLKAAGYLYGEQGSAFHIDQNEAWRLYSEAALHGVPGAMAAIADYFNGHLYQRGDPDATDSDAVLTWFGKARAAAPYHEWLISKIDDAVNRMIAQGLTDKATADSILSEQVEHFILP